MHESVTKAEAPNLLLSTSQMCQEHDTIINNLLRGLNNDSE